MAPSIDTRINRLLDLLDDAQLSAAKAEEYERRISYLRSIKETA